MLTVLGGQAEFERELIRARTGEGRERAKARGVHMGRPSKLTRHQREEARQALDDGRHRHAGRLGATLRRFTKHDLKVALTVTPKHRVILLAPRSLGDNDTRQQNGGPRIPERCLS
jgi:DNA invertase Pin-like site-specific DNA recombinase